MKEEDVKRVYIFIKESYERNGFTDHSEIMVPWDEVSDGYKERIIEYVKRAMEYMGTDDVNDYLKFLYEKEQQIIERLKEKNNEIE